MLHANLVALCFIEPELWPLCDLDLDPMTFIYKLDPYRYTGCASMNFLPEAF